MESVSIIIPTFNRFDELLLTLPQIVKYMDDKSELIIMDQSNIDDPSLHIAQLEQIFGDANVKYYHCKVPSVTLAWNTAANIATGNILLYTDDDIDIDFNLIDAHRKYYIDNPDIVGVAGGYYASSKERIWSPSSRNGSASTLAGVNASFRKDVFIKAGVPSSYVKSFAPFDWEIAEHMVTNFGKVAVGDDILVFHRAPAAGGCENQAKRGVNWYYGCYHNHFMWMLWRKFPNNLLNLPRHIYSLIKYCIPPKDVFLNADYWRTAVFKGIKDAYRQYKSDGKARATQSYKAEDIKCIITTSNNS